MQQQEKSTRALDDPLLPEKEEAEGTIGDTASNNLKPGRVSRLFQECNRVFGLAGPSVAKELLSFCSYLITTAQVGKLGASQLSAFTLARTIFHITGVSIIVGFSAALDTFSGQSFGAGQYRQVGQFLQRAILVNLVTAACILFAWGQYSEQIMLALGQQPDIVTDAKPLLLALSPAMVTFSVQVPIHSYFTSQGVIMPLTIVAGFGTFATSFVNYIFINMLDLGALGAAYSYNVLLFLEVMAFIGAMAWLHRKQGPDSKTWQGVDMTAAVSDWWTYFTIAFPSMAMICLDWWCFEVLILIAGLQPDAKEQQGAMGVMFATHSLAFMICSGFGTAAATRVSNELGAGDGRAARRATFVTAAMGFTINLFTAAGLLIFRHAWARLYSNDDAVVATVVNCMSFLCLSLVADSINAVLSGVLRGCGHQTIGFMVNLFTLWMVGIPLAYRLDIHDGRGAKGVWMALSGVSFLQVKLQVIAMATFNWDKLAKRAQRLVAAGQGPNPADLAAAAGGPGGHHGVYEPLIGAPHV